jgi:DNA repair exonuclease SbcCD ATPase subunit
MEDAMSGDISEKSPKEILVTTAAESIDETFHRIQVRIEDILSSIEDSVRLVEPELNEKLEVTLERLNTRLKGAGLGVFVTTAMKMTDEELRKGMSAEGLLSPILNAISESRSEVEDIVMKAGRGAVRNVGESTGSLQTKIVQMYATLNEHEKQLDATRAELKRWRERANELQDLVKSRDETMERSVEVLEQMRTARAELERLNEEHEQTISTVKGELSQAQSQIEQQKELLDKHGSFEEIAQDYETKLVELSEVQGQLAEAQERLAQREDTVESLKAEVQMLKESNSNLESQMSSMTEEAAALRGVKKSDQTELESLKAQLDELKARWENLYQVAEDEPAFRAYFMIADKKFTWLPLSHLSQALGVPTVLLKRNLQKFVDAGLVEIEGDRVRPLSMSELAAKPEDADKSDATGSQDNTSE